MKSKYAVYILTAVVIFSGISSLRAHALAADVPATEAPDTASEGGANETAQNIYFKGMMMASHQNYKEAAKYFEQALALNPSHYQTYIMLGQVYTRVNMHKDSEETFRKAIAIDPVEPEAYDNLMSLLLYLGRPEDAAKVADDALVAGVSFDALPDIGWSYYQAGQDGKAEAAYNRQLERDPAMFGPLRNLGILSYNKGEYEKALEYYDKAEKSGAENKTLPYLKALAYDKLGKKNEALNELFLMKQRDAKYTRKLVKLSKQFFPRNSDVSDLKEYIYGLREDWDTQRKSEGVQDGAPAAAQDGPRIGATPVDAKPDEQGTAE